MKRTAAVAALLLALALTGCTATHTSEPQEVESGSVDGISEVHIVLENGNPVTCLLYEGYKAGGLSCDWKVVHE